MTAYSADKRNGETRDKRQENWEVNTAVISACSFALSPPHHRFTVSLTCTLSNYEDSDFVLCGRSMPIFFFYLEPSISSQNGENQYSKINNIWRNIHLGNTAYDLLADEKIRRFLFCQFWWALNPWCRSVIVSYRTPLTLPLSLTYTHCFIHVIPQPLGFVTHLEHI